jgi:hypothetical protein
MNSVNFILIPIAMFVWAHMTGIPQRFKWAFKKKSIKPFDCELCLSFWIAGINNFIATNDIFFSVLVAFVAGGISNGIYSFMRKFEII